MDPRHRLATAYADSSEATERRNGHVARAWRYSAAMETLCELIDEGLAVPTEQRLAAAFYDAGKRAAHAKGLNTKRPA